MIIKLTEAEYWDADNNMVGYCIGCGESTCGGVEPDARKYPCDCCEENLVYGAAELLLMGRISITA